MDLLCDDILKSKPVIEDNIYQSSAGNETLIALQKAKLIKYKLIYKRLDKDSNANKKLRKFVAVAKKLFMPDFFNLPIVAISIL